MPSSRPIPDCLTPPNGVATRTDVLELTERVPVSTARSASAKSATATSATAASVAGFTTVRVALTGRTVRDTPPRRSRPAVTIAAGTIGPAAYLVT